MLIGAVSDTHGYVDPRLAAAFDGVELILHAGDVGGLAVLDTLAGIASVVAVRGNNDERLGGLGLPAARDLEPGGVRLHLVHELGRARPEPTTRVIVFGHSHKPAVEEREGVVYVNPGAAGRIGFHRLQTAALLWITDGTVDARIIELGARERRTYSRRNPL